LREPPNATKQTVLNQKRLFVERLPKSFTRKDAVLIAKGLGIAERSADRWISDFSRSGILVKVSFGRFEKRMVANLANGGP
jgi:hypothetical protein